MKYLTLIRHAKSSWDSPGLADIGRPLNGRGQRDAPEMGRRLEHIGFAPDLVLVSPALRARQTAEAILGALGTKPPLRVDETLYMAGRAALLDIIRANAAVGHLVLVGHNPGLTLLANHLGACDLDNIPTAGIVRFAVQGKHGDIERDALRVLDFDYPKRGKTAT